MEKKKGKRPSHSRGKWRTRKGPPAGINGEAFSRKDPFCGDPRSMSTRVSGESRKSAGRKERRGIEHRRSARALRKEPIHKKKDAQKELPLPGLGTENKSEGIFREGTFATHGKKKAWGEALLYACKERLRKGGENVTRCCRGEGILGNTDEGELSATPKAR